MALLKKVQSWNGAHIDGVGLESHLNTSSFPSTQEIMVTMSTYAYYGVDLAITELDVACSTAPCSTTDLAKQAQAYYSTVQACMNQAQCVGVTVWDFDDKYSYQNTTQPDLYFSSLTRHPAYTATDQAINGYPCTVCS